MKPIDQLLASVLSVLGVGIGQADVWVPAVRCDGAVLVNWADPRAAGSPSRRR
jgi:uncharacterized membrane protein